MIPTICHFAWLDGHLPHWAETNLESFRRHNPQIEVQVHTDNNLLSPAYELRWAEAEHPATRSDMLRYSILQQYGGIYFDLDWFHLNPLPEVVDDGRVQCVHMQPDYPATSAMACRADHPAFATLRDKFGRRRPEYVIGLRALYAAHVCSPDSFAHLQGAWCGSALESILIYANAHDIALPDMDLGNWQQYTAVHLPSTAVHLSGAGDDAAHELRVGRMYIHFKACEHLG